jgi:hypothetical protein
LSLTESTNGPSSVRQGPLSNVLGMLSAIKKLIITAFKARILTKLALPKVVLLWLGYRMLKAFLGRKRKRKSDSQ